MKVRGMARLPRALSLLASLVIVAAISVGFGLMYFNDHAWGAWGDDSAGYIFLAGRMWQQEPLVYIDELAAQGLEFFGDEKLARWLTPTHHQFISPTGWIASKYPLGTSLLMFVGAWLKGSTDGFYLITPFLATLNIVLIFILAIVIFNFTSWRYFIGLSSAFFMGISNLYYEYAIAQPMREMPSITLLLLLAITFTLSLPVKSSKKSLFWLILSGLFFGLALNIRETNVMVLPAIILALFFNQSTVHWPERLKKVCIKIFLFCCAAFLAYLPSIWNVYNISQHKVPFKQRDTSGVVLLSNIGHLETLSWKNIFSNEGKFRPGKGALPHYWQTLQKVVPVPFFLVFVFFGFYALWRRSKPLTTFLVLWIFGILFIFSLWINPYTRYILPLFPPLLLLGSYGIVICVKDFLPRIFSGFFSSVFTMILLMGIFIMGYQPLIVEGKQNLSRDFFQDKAISKNDLQNLVGLGQSFKNYSQPLLMFSGSWQWGMSETFEAHTDVKAIHFPLEQKFVFDPKKIDIFFQKIINSGYSVFVWLDETSSREMYDFLEQYEYKEIETMNFSFQQNVKIYKLILPK